MAILAFTLPGVPCICITHKLKNNQQAALMDKLYDDLSRLHRNHPALQRGLYRYVQNSASSLVFSFFRYSGEDSVLIVVNFANEKKEANIRLPAGVSLVWKDLISGLSNTVMNSHLTVTVVPLGFLMMVPSSEKEIL
jgi:hypothetical protein